MEQGTKGPAGPGAAPASPGGPPPRPDLADVFRLALLLYLRHWLAFFLPYGAVGLAVALLSFLFFPEPFSSPLGLGLGAAGDLVPPTTLALAALLSLLIRLALPSLVLGGAALYALARRRGEALGMREALRRGLRRFPAVFAASLLLALLMAALLAGPVAAAFLGASGLSFAALIPAAFAAVFLFASLNLYLPVIMAEGLGPLASLRRSWVLTRGRRGPLFGVYLALLLLALALFVGFNIPMDASGSLVVIVALGAARTGLLAPWFAIAGAVAYDLIVGRPPRPAEGPRATRGAFPASGRETEARGPEFRPPGRPRRPPRPASPKLNSPAPMERPCGATAATPPPSP